MFQDPLFIFHDIALNINFNDILYKQSLYIDKYAMILQLEINTFSQNNILHVPDNL